MDTECNEANVAHKPPPLNSDQLNYLIWRYLQEAGYAEAAVKLQRDWKVELESLSFAKHIKSQALISLVQKGLKYHHLSLTVDENGQQTKGLVPSMFFFGPESAPIDSTPVQKESLLKVIDSTRAVSPASTIANASRSKPRDAVSNAPDESAPQAPKRGRKPAQSLSTDRNGVSVRKVSGASEAEVTNGHMQQNAETTSPSNGENITEDVVMTNGTHEDEMDVDDEVREPLDTVVQEHIDETFAPLIPTLTNGVSVEIQASEITTKPKDMAPLSAVLSLPTSHTVTRLLWQPADATATLIAQGQTFAGLWNLAGRDLQPDSVKPLPQSLFSSDNVGLVTAVSWHPDGTVLALATYSEQGGQVHMFDGEDLTLVESLPASHRAVTILRWNPYGHQLVGIAPFEDSNGEVDVTTSTLLSWEWSLESGAIAPCALTLPGPIFDIACGYSDGECIIWATSKGVAYECRGSMNVSIVSKYEERRAEDDEFTFVKLQQMHDGHVEVIAAATETATIWMPLWNTLQPNAHKGPITALEVRPVPMAKKMVFQNGDDSLSRYIEYATSSIDGYVHIYRSKPSGASFGGSPDLIHRIQMSPSRPSLMSLSFSPDGLWLTSASYNLVHMWNAQNEYQPVASWDGEALGWRGTAIKDDDLTSTGGRSSVNGDGGSVSAEHTLAWHTSGKQLAFGLGTQVAIFNLQKLTSTEEVYRDKLTQLER